MALSRERDTPSADNQTISIPLAANAVVWKGGIAVIDAGYGKPGATALNLIAAGRWEESVSNSGGANGDKRATARRGVYRFKNHGADAVVQADLGKDCFIVDDETVAKTNGGNTRSIAGKVQALDSAGVWVAIG